MAAIYNVFALRSSPFAASKEQSLILLIFKTDYTYIIYWISNQMNSTFAIVLLYFNRLIHNF